MMAALQSWFREWKGTQAAVTGRGGGGATFPTRDNSFTRGLRSSFRGKAAALPATGRRGRGGTNSGLSSNTTNYNHIINYNSSNNSSSNNNNSNKNSSSTSSGVRTGGSFTAATPRANAELTRGLSVRCRAQAYGSTDQNGSSSSKAANVASAANEGAGTSQPPPDAEMEQQEEALSETTSAAPSLPDTPTRQHNSLAENVNERDSLSMHHTPTPDYRFHSTSACIPEEDYEVGALDIKLSCCAWCEVLK